MKKRGGVINEVVFGKQTKNVGYLYVAKIDYKRNIYKVGRTKNLLNRIYMHQTNYGKQMHYVYISDLLFNYVECEMNILDKLGEPVVNFGEEFFLLGSLELEVLIIDIKKLEKISYMLFEQEKWEEGIDEYDFKYERCY